MLLINTSNRMFLLINFII
jgi:hypothetical protein